MSDAKIDLESFLDEMVSVLEKRLKEHERAIKRLEKELSALKSGKGRISVDKSVLRVLRGK
jgi:hypothetical protein